jgi:hypothetical protein
MHNRAFAPTQITVGMIEVEDKREHLKKLDRGETRDFLRDHPIPAVFGPEDKVYLTDHHHLGRALSEAKIEHGFFLVEADFSKLDDQRFWTTIRANAWVQRRRLREGVDRVRGIPVGRFLPHARQDRADA